MLGVLGVQLRVRMGGHNINIYGWVGGHVVTCEPVRPSGKALGW